MLTYLDIMKLELSYNVLERILIIELEEYSGEKYFLTFGMIKRNLRENKHGTKDRGTLKSCTENYNDTLLFLRF